MKFEAGIALNHQDSNERKKTLEGYDQSSLHCLHKTQSKTLQNELKRKKKEIEKSKRRKKMHKNKDHNEIARKSSKKHKEKIAQ